MTAAKGPNGPHKEVEPQEFVRVERFDEDSVAVKLGEFPLVRYPKGYPDAGEAYVAAVNAEIAARVHEKDLRIAFLEGELLGADQQADAKVRRAVEDAEVKEREWAASILDRYADFWATQKKKGFFVQMLRDLAKEIRTGHLDIIATATPPCESAGGAWSDQFGGSPTGKPGIYGPP